VFGERYATMTDYEKEMVSHSRQETIKAAFQFSLEVDWSSHRQLISGMISETTALCNAVYYMVFCVMITLFDHVPETKQELNDLQVGMMRG
jgi:hypothetical protein